MTTSALSTPLAEIAEKTWRLDPVHSHVGFRVRHMGVATMRGQFTDFDAYLDRRDGDSVLEGTAQVASVDTRSEQLTGHLHSPEWFDAERHPRLSFRSLPVHLEPGQPFQVDGELTIKGNTRSVRLSGTCGGVAEDPYGNTRLGLELTTELDRREFGLDWDAPLPGGGSVVAANVILDAALEFVAEET